MSCFIILLDPIYSFVILHHTKITTQKYHWTVKRQKRVEFSPVIIQDITMLPHDGLLYLGPLLVSGVHKDYPSFLIGWCWPLIGHNSWPVSLVTHVSSDQGCRYFHQPRPLRLGTQLTHGAQHSLGAKEQRTFLLAHFHVLRKFRQRWEQIKHSSQLSQHISCLSPDLVTCAWSQSWHSQGQGQPSDTARENWSQARALS